MTSSGLRDAHAQKKYRDQSKSTRKQTQHVAHYFSLDIAVYINKFVTPPVAKHTLKHLCNDEDNFRMIEAKTNLSNHKTQDNKLMKSFENIILGKFKENERYTLLLSTNVCKLEFEINKDQMQCITLKWNEAQRATAQTKRLQRLCFPNRYLAFARLFYRCFKDSKERNIWDDRRNSKEFKIYLKQQLNKKMDAVSHDEKAPHENMDAIIDDDEKESVPLTETDAKAKIDDHDDEKAFTETTNDGQLTGESQNVKELDSIRKDNKGRQLYEGTQGGIYYLTKAGNKVYVTSTEKSSDHKTSDAVHEDDDDQKSVPETEVMNDVKLKNNVTDNPKSDSNEDIKTGKDDKGRQLYQGSKGSIYYKTASGNRVYIKKK